MSRDGYYQGRYFATLAADGAPPCHVCQEKRTVEFKAYTFPCPRCQPNRRAIEELEAMYQKIARHNDEVPHTIQRIEDLGLIEERIQALRDQTVDLLRFPPRKEEAT